MHKLLIIYIILLSPLTYAKEFLTGTVREPSFAEQYNFNKSTLTNSCNRLKQIYGEENVTLSTRTNKKFYNRNDNECIRKVYPGNYIKYQNTKFGTNSFLNK